MKNAEHKTRKKYLHKILASYLCFVLISLISSTMIYQLAHRRLTEKTINSDYAVFQQFYQIVDQELNGAADKVSELQKDYTGILRWMNEDSIGTLSDYSTYQIFQNLRIVCNNNLSDLFIYLRNSRKIVSGYYATLSPEYYFSTYYSGDYNFDEFFQINTTRELLQMTTCRGEKTVALKMPVFSPSPYSVVCVLNPRHLGERMNSLEQSIGGNIMMIDKNNHQLLCSSLLGDIDISSVSLQEGIHHITIAGKEYVAFAKDSTVVACRYVSLIPIETMDQSLSLFRVSTVINLIVFCLFGILLALLLTKHNYKPISHLMKSAFLLNGRKKQTEIEAQEEFEYLETIIENAISEKKKYLSELSGLQHVRKSNLILNLINGTIPIGATAQSLFAEINEALISERFAVMLFCIEEWNDEVFSQNYADERPLLSQIIFPNVIEEICQENNRGYVTNINQNQFVCIVNLSPEETIEALTSIAERARCFLNDKMGILCTVGIGNPCSSLKDIRFSFNEAKRAEEYKIIHGAGKVLFYGSLLASAKVSYNFIPNTSLQISLIQCIKERSSDPGEIFDEIYAHCFAGEQPKTPEAARSFILDLCTQLNEILDELDSQNPVLFSGLQFNLDIETYKTILEFREYFVRHISDIRRGYQEHHTVKSIGKNISEFIEEHYADMNLGVNEIGIRFGLSSAYCSKIYKQETNQSIPESICAIRLNHACKLLVETPNSLELIAQKCGFTSSAVFIRSFKKFYGVTPGNYRKLMEK